MLRPQSSDRALRAARSSVLAVAHAGGTQPKDCARRIRVASHTRRAHTIGMHRDCLPELVVKERLQKYCRKIADILQNYCRIIAEFLQNYYGTPEELLWNSCRITAELLPNGVQEIQNRTPKTPEGVPESSWRLPRRQNSIF